MDLLLHGEASPLSRRGEAREVRHPCRDARSVAAPPPSGLVLIAPDAAPRAASPGRIPVILPEIGAALQPDTARELAGPDGRVEVVPGPDATWQSGLPALARAAMAWLEAPSARR